MQHKVAFHQGLHYLLSYKQSVSNSLNSDLPQHSYFRSVFDIFDLLLVAYSHSHYSLWSIAGTLQLFLTSFIFCLKKQK